MIARILLLFFMVASSIANGQLLDQLGLDTVKVYRSLDRALKAKGPVYALDLSGSKLKEVPLEIRSMTSLNVLYLGRNKLRALPDWMSELASLQELSFERNKLKQFPPVLCKLMHLKRLGMGRNSISELPSCIGQLEELRSLDLWGNNVIELPVEAEGLKQLKWLDLTVISMEQDEMDAIRELVPWAEVKFSPPCNCGL